MPDLRTAVIFTALAVEANAVLAHLSDIETEIVERHAFEVGEFRPDAGTTWRVAVVELGPGNIDTASLVRSAANHFGPEALLFAGIAGSLKSDDVDLGDVVAGASVSWTERSKETDQGTLHRARIANASTLITSLARKAARQGRWVSRMIGAEPKDPPNLAVVGQIASGEKLIASETTKEDLRLVHSDALVIENEGFGFTSVAAASVTAEFIVIRGVSDDATGAKDDSHHGVAAAAAAAFAFEVLAQLSENLRISSVPESSTNPEVGTRQHAGPALLEELITDEDIAADKRSEVEVIARNIALRPDFDLGEGLERTIRALDAAVLSRIISRRLEWTARVFVGSEASEPSLLESDEFYRTVRTHQLGAARALMHASTWSALPARVRRVLLSGVLGPSSEPEPPNAEGARLIVPLAEAGLLSDDEAERFARALAPGDYETLAADGIPLELLVPRILSDLRSGEFSLQNRAARFLYRTEQAQGGPAALNSVDDAQVGASLVDAAPASYPSNGALEALDSNRLLGWSLSRLAGALWASLTTPDRRDFVWAIGVRGRDLIAAAVAKDALRPVLEITKGLIESRDLTPTQGADWSVLWESLDEISDTMQGEERAAFEEFAAWLRERASDGSRHVCR